MNTSNDNSAQPCGCDLGAGHECDYHRRLTQKLQADHISPSADAFIVKDSGKRETFASGMVRDTQEGKLDYTLILDGPMFDRWAEHLTKGAVKYEARNWMKARGEAEYERFRASAIRHLRQWLRGDRDEDHAAAVYFNINGAEYIKTL